MGGGLWVVGKPATCVKMCHVRSCCFAHDPPPTTHFLTRRRFAASLAGSLATARLFAIPPRPKLFVLLAAEQFRSDYLTRFSNLLGPGGFRRLMEEGSYLPDCRMSASAFS